MAGFDLNWRAELEFIFLNVETQIRQMLQHIMKSNIFDILIYTFAKLTKNIN